MSGERRFGRAGAEEVAEATVEGDVEFLPGTARAALAHRPFRIVWIGAFASNVGSWMQNVVLLAFGYQLTGSPVYVSLLGFAQLGPLLLFSIPGGALADRVDRRRLMVTAQAFQMGFSLLLAALARGGDPSRAGLVAAVFGVGSAAAVNGPAFGALVPALVGRRDLPGAISLQSVQMNLSRVVGPALGGLLFPWLGAAGVFLVNAATYLFVIAALMSVDLPNAAPAAEGDRGWRALSGGLRVARRDPLVRRVLTAMSAFSFACLGFIGLMPVLAEENLGIAPKSAAYGLLYASFGLGAATGAFLLGTRRAAALPRDRTARAAMAAFAVVLALFGLARARPLAFLLALAVGISYFLVVTSMMTVLQQHLADAVRGRVMALWMMAWGGTVPLGTLAAGPVATHFSMTGLMLVQAACALALAAYTDVRSARLAAESA